MEGSPGEVELGRLATPEEDCEDDEPEEEEEVVVKEEMKSEDAEEVEEEEDVKAEEKVSLLEGRGSPLPSSTGTSMNTQELPRVTETVVVLPNPYLPSLVTQGSSRVSPPDPDIQLAEVEAPVYRTRRVPSSFTSPSSLHTVCGPRPARITAACLLVLSLWATFMLLIHINKKIDNLSSSLESTNEKLKTMEEMNEEFRSNSLQRLKSMGKLVHSLREGVQGARRARTEPGHSPPPATPSPRPTTTTLQDTPTSTEDDGWGVGWPSWGDP